MVHGEGDDDFGNAPWIGNRTDGIVDVFRVDEAGDEDRIARIQARGSFSTDQACDEEIRLVARNLRGDVIATRDEPVCSQQVWMIGE
jgi:hypothetical protein